DVGEPRRRFPDRHFALGLAVRSHVETDCAADALVDRRRREPSGVAGPGGDRLPHLLGRAGHDELHLDPAVSRGVLLYWHFTSHHGGSTIGSGGVATSAPGSFTAA